MNKHKIWIEPVARFGYAARGVVYIIIGGLAIWAALVGGDTAGSEGALQKVVKQPFGQILLAIVVIGLLSYAVWRAIQAFGDPDQHGTDLKGLAIRGGLITSAMTYTFLAIYAISLLGLSLSGGGDGGGGGVHGKLAEFIGSNWASVVLAVTFTGVAIAHFMKVVKRGYEKYYLADEKVMLFVHPIAMTGLAARGITFLVIAYLFACKLFAGGRDVDGTPGLEAALTFIRGLTAGSVLLSAIGIGLVLFAFYSLTEAVWREINVEDA